ncbi:50S ribosomal protein L16 [Candidatus Woesearchaeota archaeon]|nr:50S ribosomal protein L16 [Candidatus Woesearchaeota archaeon]
MALRKAKCYRKVVRAYTRKSKFRAKAFIKTIPNSKVVKYDLGNTKKQFEKEVNLISKDKVQIRHNALESARMVVNRRLNQSLGNNYHFKLRVYPHHILRENKALTGAGADRMSSGMKQSFGTPIGLAAQVKIGQPIISVYVDSKDVNTAREALRYAIHRLPCKCAII